MRVWDARDGHLIHKGFGGHGGPGRLRRVQRLMAAPIASAGYDHTCQALVAPTTRESNRGAVLNGHTDEVRARGL